MRKILQSTGVLVLLIGLSGAIDHLWHQPFLGFVLNSFNRFVIPNVALLDEYALFANLAVGAVGVVMVLAAKALAPQRRH
ncbi:hypothetical protein BJF83_12240 [Nocardiopsis sp. CNR-923]|uniref:hypothetical protein n=1 Tax=Nocardiopsis sp. CNR-923 TaxID=1904965 RepID=UPI000962E50C|nr:hypothetical protein [Nocardiopsis sp. CNR-923]OLT29342.1 hypothetical protein BJF83_12240 [Nocardiopsis sp. CNR-923]